MATIVNTPGTPTESSNSSGILAVILLVLALVFLFWFFGMPYLRGGNTGGAPTTNVENNVQAPSVPDQAQPEGGDTNINVPIPDEVDVNVRNDQDGQ